MIIDAHVTVSSDEDFKELLKSLDRTGTDFAVISGSHKEFAFANTDGNLRLAKLCEFDGRLRFWAVCTPWSGEKGLAEIDRALDDGAIGVAFDSSTQGFSMFDSEIRLVLDHIASMEIPVYFHTGTPVNALPLQLSVLAQKYPSVNFIMGRSGRTDFRTDAIPAMRASSNIFADTCHDYPDTGLLALRDNIGFKRMIFTSDFPIETMDFGRSAINAMKIPDTEKEQILGGNFAKLTAKGSF